MLSRQYGFRKNHSCESALNLLLLEWKTVIENEKRIIVGFLDLKRAFATVERNRLIMKLRKYGIVGNWTGSLAI